MDVNTKIDSHLCNSKETISFKKKNVSFGLSNSVKLYKADLQRRATENGRKFLKTQPWYARLSHYFSHPKFQGDIANVIITAIGTGFFAPVMIAKNPLSNQDKDTKTYAAWRQPISAVIAVVTQVGITKQVGNIIKGLAKEGKLGKELDTRDSDKYTAQANKHIETAEFLNSLTENPERAEFLDEMTKDPLRKGLYPEKTHSEKKINAFLGNVISELKKKSGNKSDLSHIVSGIRKEEGKSIPQKIAELTEIMNDPKKAKKFITKKAEQYNKLAEGLTKKASSITGGVNKYKDLVGIGVALITLPITCELLNRVYPVFMRKYFPELSSKKAENQHKNNDYNIPFAKEIKTNAGGLK